MSKVCQARLSKPSIQKFNALLPWPVRIAMVVAVGLSLRGAVLLALYDGWAVKQKLSRKAPGCSWARVASYYFDQKSFSDLYEAALKSIVVEEQKDPLGLQQVTSNRRKFWMKSTEQVSSHGVAYLLAEHDWMNQENPGSTVRPGDIVLDCGAHVGVFTNKALELGAPRVISIEPDPINVECLRRSYREEIAAGQVIVVPKGVWSREQTIQLSLGLSPAWNSLVRQVSDDTIEVPVTTIDKLVETLGLPRVDYIKMDIEGSEREALQGARETLRRFRPRLMLDSYHRRDDMAVLPPLVRQANPQYSMICGPCEPFADDHSLLVPHVTYYQ